MKKLLITITAFILLNAFFYLLMSFSDLTLNFVHWTSGTRNVFCLLSGFSAFLFTMIVYAQYEAKNKQL